MNAIALWYFFSFMPLNFFFFFHLQLSFQMWTNQIQETINAKKNGDSAFKAKDFNTAIEHYTLVRIHL